MSHVIACIDGSQFTPAVCDYSAWASKQLDAPLTLLHVLDRQPQPQSVDLSGSIGLGSQESLLLELASLDEQRAKLALEQGRLMLEAAKQRAIFDGIADPNTRQRHGELAETISELEDNCRLVVMGKQGLTSTKQLVGGHLENVIRTTHRPVLVTTGDFKIPQNLMVAFDGSTTSLKIVDMLAKSPLLQGLPVHVVIVGANTQNNQELLESANSVLASAHFKVHTAILDGEVEPALHAYQTEHSIDLLVMGAYGHSRIRQFLVGSTTTNMIRTTTTPILLLR